MRSRAGGMLAVLAVVGAAVAGCGSETPPTPAPAGNTAVEVSVSGSTGVTLHPTVATPAPAPTVRTITVSFAGGKVSGETGRVPVARGETVDLVVTSDVAEEAHLHGYDKAAQIPAGGTATIRLVADIPGVFEFELHHSGAELLSLRVA
jgi:FtsP/CotA-like multicopper oxidase with cupredoxin domain